MHAVCVCGAGGCDVTCLGWAAGAAAAAAPAQPSAQHAVPRPAACLCRRAGQIVGRCTGAKAGRLETHLREASACWLCLVAGWQVVDWRQGWIAGLTTACRPPPLCRRMHPKDRRCRCCGPRRAAPRAAGRDPAATAPPDPAGGRTRRAPVTVLVFVCVCVCVDRADWRPVLSTCALCCSRCLPCTLQIPPHSVVSSPDLRCRRCLRRGGGGGGHPLRLHPRIQLQILARPVP